MQTPCAGCHEIGDSPYPRPPIRMPFSVVLTKRSYLKTFIVHSAHYTDCTYFQPLSKLSLALMSWDVVLRDVRPTFEVRPAACRGRADFSPRPLVLPTAQHFRLGGQVSQHPKRRRLVATAAQRCPPIRANTRPCQPGLSLRGSSKSAAVAIKHYSSHSDGGETSSCCDRMKESDTLVRLIGAGCKLRKGSVAIKK